MPGELGGPSKNLLTTIKHEKPVLRPKDPGDPLGKIVMRSFLDADRPGHRCPQQGRIWYLAQVNKVDSVGEP